mmetsp:Transcript_5938/g.24531  ORF Transcript_5938/g.24531 Transcript_5938/m.24531 type:complete len:291 (-) Transcript_5938:154-1026(-)
MNLVPGTRIQGGGGGGGSAGGTYRPGLGPPPPAVLFTAVAAAVFDPKPWAVPPPVLRRFCGCGSSAGSERRTAVSPLASANTGATPAGARVGCQPFDASAAAGCPPFGGGADAGAANPRRRASTAASSARRLAPSPTWPSAASAPSSAHPSSAANVSRATTAIGAKSPWSTAWSHAATSCHSPSPPSSHVAPMASSSRVSDGANGGDSSLTGCPSSSSSRHPPSSRHALTCASLAASVSARSRRGRKHTGHVVASSSVSIPRVPSSAPASPGRSGSTSPSRYSASRVSGI